MIALKPICFDKTHIIAEVTVYFFQGEIKAGGGSGNSNLRDHKKEQFCIHLYCTETEWNSHSDLRNLIFTLLSFCARMPSAETVKACLVANCLLSRDINNTLKHQLAVCVVSFKMHLCYALTVGKPIAEFSSERKAPKHTTHSG